MRFRAPLILGLSLLVAPPALGVIIDSGDGTGNTSAPVDDPGFDNVGIRAPAYSAVYLGWGWVLATQHAGTGDLTLKGGTYTYVPGSYVRIWDETGPQADLRIYRIDPKPPLEALEIRADPLPDPATNTTEVVMIGNGRNRGASYEYENECPPGPPGCVNEPDGYLWLSSRTIRWGKNVIEQILPDLTDLEPFTTDSFVVAFDRGEPDANHESQGTIGDSGGAVFIKNGGNWELAGIMHSIDVFVDQPDYDIGGNLNSSIYENLTLAADLSSYRDQIWGFVRPACWPSCGPCNNGIDDDGDGTVDDGNDPGCRNEDWHTESPECDDGVDNDGDGATDVADLQCGNAWQVSESPTSGCGLGAELAFLLPILNRLRRLRLAL
jgi:hypothetical protein